jgi:hypothetical protein
MAIAKEIKKKFYYINSQILCELEYKVTFNKEIRDCRRSHIRGFWKEGNSEGGKQIFWKEGGDFDI